MKAQRYQDGALVEVDDEPAGEEQIAHVRDEHRLPIAAGWTAGSLEEVHERLHELDAIRAGAAAAGVQLEP